MIKYHCISLTIILAKYTVYKKAVLRIPSALEWYTFVLKRPLRQDYVKKKFFTNLNLQEIVKDVRYLHTHRVGLF
jgi:hypothetical protein